MCSRMQIFVNGLEGQRFPLEVTGEETVEQLRSEVAARHGGVPAEELRLVHCGRYLELEEVVGEAGLGQESHLHVALTLPGGAKKRKKKNYTTPKKNKHKKKKVKLAILKCYKTTPRLWTIAGFNTRLDSSSVDPGCLCQVDENGKITRLRRECNSSDDCGAGCFMASHYDRQSCGKCGTTYVFQPPAAEA
ncbi:RPS27A [Cordylochernes scorpioides]|uniref:RPS27A n=1 Tax=Cordylochernes scorpioides TaxID=51811 RepID=A0ABY6L2J5_9ARAC|nr:RPS27A [Cordylochernes scorpioides]